MNSVALPASASTQALSAEADLVRQAARGDAEAFEELFRRHSAPAWRLAQAVTTDRPAATTAFRDGFVRAVKSGRFARRAATTFRPHVLSSVYRSAIDQAYDRTAAPAPAQRAAADTPQAALTDAAFRSLPERWRAALWLSEVENLESERVAAVLGVSASVAEQLVTRGRRGLAGRFAQAHREMPEHVGEILRPLTLAAPANLAEVTRKGWSTAGADHLSVMTPVAGWLEARAIRPMSVAVGGLIGLGLIGLGVVPGVTVRSQLAGSGVQNNLNAVPVQTCTVPGCQGGSGIGTTGTTGGGGFDSAAYNLFNPSFQSGAGAGGGFSGAGPYLTSGSGGGSGTGTGSGGYTPPGQSPSGSTTPTPGQTPPPPPPGGNGGTPLVTLPGGLGSVGTSGSNLTTNLGGSGGVNLSAGTGGISGSVGGTPLPTNSLTTTPSSGTTSGSTTTTTLAPLQAVTQTVTTTVSGATSTITSTVTTLLPGL